MSALRRRLGLLYGAVVIAISCGAPQDRAGDTSAQWVGASKRTSLLPLAWLTDGNQLLFMRTDRLTSGDVGRISCDSSGLYAFQENAIRLRKGGASVCQLLSHVDDASLDADGQHLVHADVFAQGRIFRLDLEGLSKEEVPTECLPASSAPALSRDGRKIAFVASCQDPNGQAFLHIAEVDGSHARALPQGTPRFREDYPSWAPNGRRIVFVRGHGASSDEIVVIDTATGVRRTVAQGRDPSWSPTGDWILYMQLDSTQSSPHSLRLVKPEGTGDRELYRFPDSVPGSRTGVWLPTRPIWSPDGRQIAFGSQASIWVMALNDTGPRLLVELPK